MEQAEPEVHNILLDEDNEFRTLASQHAEFDARLEELTSKHLPTEQERLEEVRLKKQKLLLKDQMASRIRDYRGKAAVTH